MNNSKRFFKGKFFIFAASACAIIMLFVIVINSVNFKTADTYTDAPYCGTTIKEAIEDGKIDDYEYFKNVAQVEVPVINSQMKLTDKFQDTSSRTADYIRTWAYSPIFIEDESLTTNAVATFYMCEYAVEQSFADGYYNYRYSKKITPFLDDFFLAVGSAEGIDATPNALWLGRKKGKPYIIDPTNGYLSMPEDHPFYRKSYSIDTALVIRIPKGCAVTSEYSQIYPTKSYEHDNGGNYA